MKIAIVEDEIRIREGLRRLLERLFPQDEIVGEAGDGKSGLALLLETGPDLVLADIRMPEMDGMQMLRAARDQGCAPVVILLSAYSDFDYAREAMKLGVSEYLVKPVTADELAAAVNGARELVEHRHLSQMGQCTLAEMLLDALLSPVPPEEDALAYMEKRLDFPARDSLGLLLLQAEEGAQEEWRRLTAASPIRSETVPCGEYLATVFAGFGSEEHLAFVLENELLSAVNHLSAQPALAILTTVSGLAGLHEAFSALQAHFEFSLIAPPGRLMRYPGILDWPLTLLTYPVELETQCRAALGKQDREALLAGVRQFGSRLLGGQMHHPREIKEAYMRFALSLLSTGRELGQPADESNRLITGFMAAHRLSDMDAYLLRLAESLCAEDGETVGASMLVRRAAGLMKEYYAQGITLEEIAQRLSVTPEHLGTKIHRELGCTFGTLMKRLRVEYAKKLLLTTDMRLYEIAMAVGYTDPKYFSSVFKKSTGMLPMDFRAMNR